MRLSSVQINAIVAAAAELAGPDAQVRLFGSRLDDSLHGGDIDLLVECPNKVARPVWLAAQITARLQRTLDDRKIDVLLVDPDTAIQPIHRIARAQSVLLSPAS